MLGYIEKAWKEFKKNWLAFVVAQLLALLIPGIVVLIGLGVFFASFFSSVGFSSMEEPYTEEMIADYVLSVLSDPRMFSALLSAISIASIFFLIGIILSLFLRIGMYGMASEALRGKTRVRTMFRVARKSGLTAILCSIIQLLIVLLLIVVSVLLGIIIPIIGFFIGLIFVFFVVIMFSLSFPAIVVDHLKAWDAIKKSVYVVRKNYFQVLGLLVVFAVLGVIIGWIPWVGFLVASLVVSPLQMITFVVYYKKSR